MSFSLCIKKLPFTAMTALNKRLAMSPAGCAAGSLQTSGRV